MSDDERKAATLSRCGAYRYTLARWWGDEGAPGLLWVLLNPSTADGTQDDPTVRKLRAYARAWGAPGFVVVNAFAFRATNPWEVPEAKVDPVGPENDAHIVAEAARAQAIVIGWGVALADTPLAPRFGAVLRLLEPHRAKVGALKLTKSGAPTHPLYLPGALRPRAYPAAYWPEQPSAMVAPAPALPAARAQKPRAPKPKAEPARELVTERFCRCGSLWSWAPVAGAWRVERVAGCGCPEPPAPSVTAPPASVGAPAPAAGPSATADRAPAERTGAARPAKKARRTRARDEESRSTDAGPGHPAEVGLFGEVPYPEPRPRAPRAKKKAAAAAPAAEQLALTPPLEPAITPVLPTETGEDQPRHPQAGAQGTPPGGEARRDAQPEESAASAGPGGPELPPAEPELDLGADPCVGDVWLADLRGKVAWAANYSERTRGAVTLEWVSRDRRVCEGSACKGPRSLPVRVTLARSALVGRIARGR